MRVNPFRRRPELVLPGELATMSPGKRRAKALRSMALGLGIDPDRYRTDTAEGQMALWAAISEQVAGGVARTSEPILGDPFAVFVTGTCTDMHDGRGHYKQTAAVKTGARVDQAQGEDIVRYLKAERNVNRCEICDAPITVWQVDNVRVSTYAERDGFAMESSTGRGPYQ